MAARQALAVSLPARPHRKLRYLLVRDAAGWRVDDVIGGDEKGFSARDVSAVLTWVFVHLSQADMVDRVDRFVAFPLQLCGPSGGCQSVPKNDARLVSTLGLLHRAYYRGDEDDSRKWSPLFPKNSEILIEGTTVQMDALELTLQGKAWWVMKIDLRALGRTIPVNGVSRRIAHQSS